MTPGDAEGEVVTVFRSAMLRVVIACTALAARSACGTESGADPLAAEPVTSQPPILLTYPLLKNAFDMDALIVGDLELNDAHCFTIGGIPIVVPETWHVNAAGDGIVLPSGQEWLLGAPVRWGGGVSPYDPLSPQQQACLDGNNPSPNVMRTDIQILNPEH